MPQFRALSAIKGNPFGGGRSESGKEELFFRRKSQTVAFSLVEVVIAIGIISFCLLVIVGVMSIAYRSNEDASDRTGEALILQSTRGLLANTPYTNLITSLGSANGIWLGFTEEGRFLGMTNSGPNLTNTATFYRVQVLPATAAELVNYSSVHAIIRISKPPPVFNQTTSFPTAFARYGSQY